jgi:hypothetical protein
VTETTQKLIATLNLSEAEYDSNYKIWQNKDEWKLVNGVRTRINDMYTARQSGCYLTNFDGSTSWDTHWDLVEKNFLMYTEIDNDDDDPQPSLKSNMAYRTIMQIDAKERKQQIDFMVEARNEDDETKGTAVTHQYIFKDYFRRNPDIRYRFFDVTQDAKVFGTGIGYVPYTTRIQEAMKPKTPDIKQEDIENGEFPETEYEKEYRVDFEDIDFVRWDIRDFYVDPNAQCLHGSSHVATDCAGILYVTPSQVRMMFKGDKGAKNLDKLNPSSTESYSSPFFKPPRDYDDGYCELIFYYNRETDSEIIICDDILIKEGPIPYEDKEHPFVVFRLVRKAGQFYGMGIVDALLQLSAEDSAMKNARIRNTRLQVEAPIFMGATIFGEVENQLDRIEPGQIIKVADVNQTKVMETPNIPFDSWRVSEELKDEAVMVTGINPQGLTLPMSSTPATNTIAMKETMSDIANMYGDNIMQGMGWWGYLIESRVCQFYKLPTRKAALELNKKQMRELRLEDIMLYDDEGQLKTREIKGSKIIPLEKKHFEWNKTPRIYISPDFVAPISEAFKMRKAQEILPQLAPFAGEPGQVLASGQKAVIRLRKLIGWYLDQMKVRDQDFLIDEDEDRMQEIEQAIDQQQAMMDGEEIEGIPGEPTVHKYTHAVELMRLNSTTQADEFIQMMQNPDPQVQQFVSALMDYKQKLTEHARVDNIVAEQASEAAVAESQAFDQMTSGQGQGPGMPSNNGVEVPLVSGAMGLPNQGGVPVPNKMGPEDITGQGMGTVM